MGTSQEMTKRPRRNRVAGCNRDMFSYPRLTWITFRLSTAFNGFSVGSVPGNVNGWGLGHIRGECVTRPGTGDSS
jgi:hypothetical protein